jgi:hypothetical protein
MNDSIVTLALMRHGEMMRQAEHGRLVARIRRAVRRETRAQLAGRPVVRIRPTVTGR